MKITMDMSSYEIEEDSMGFEEYEEEISDAGWSSPVELACGLREIETADNPATDVITEIVLRKMYSYEH